VPEQKTFFAERYYQNLLAALRGPGSDSEAWLVDVLALLVENVAAFPPPDDEDSYVVEYIYPH
jgi:hypothetical protein